MAAREKFDSPPFTLGFAEQSKCTCIEILQYPGLADPLVTEGSLDDESLPSWLSKVPLLCSVLDNFSLIALRISHSRSLLNRS
jgi:hypothetical protein